MGEGTERTLRFMSYWNSPEAIGFSGQRWGRIKRNSARKNSFYPENPLPFYPSSQLKA